MRETPRVLPPPHLRPGLLPRHRAGAAPLRTPGLEHPLRVQRVRYAHLRAAAQALPRRERERALQRAAVHRRRVQLRWARDGRQGPPHAAMHPAALLQRTLPGREAQHLPLGYVCLPARREPGELHRVHRRAASGGHARGLRPARERHPDEGPERHKRSAVVCAGHGGRGQLGGRRGRLQGGDDPYGGGRHRCKAAGELRHGVCAAEVPCALGGEYEHRAVPGADPVQQPAHFDALESGERAEGGQGAGGDVPRPGGAG
mmetsp:Transcript_8245/g.18089  ORF Transcript_8245/g.18089 Transcript_8245/m.18089 type:complete len:259 (-) Transcript_8245:766-1542(-)